MSTDYTEFESKMKKTASVLTEQYDSVRAGKANPAAVSYTHLTLPTKA